jgi:hypothetical protein
MTRMISHFHSALAHCEAVLPRLLAPSAPLPHLTPSGLGDDCQRRRDDGGEEGPMT